MPKRASLEKVKKFCNEVREAGGGNAIDALMPAIPEDSKQCLIAKNLNFKCQVDTPDDPNQWVMLTTKKLARTLADKLGLKYWESTDRIYDQKSATYKNVKRFGVALPKDIGQVAADFDTAGDALGHLYTFDEDKAEYRLDKEELKALQKENPLKFKEIKTFLPYILESAKQAKKDGFLTPEGKLVL